jgi:hypothetical protein
VSHRALNGEQFAGQQRLFDIKSIPTKKDYPQPGPRPNPNFEQPHGGETIGKYLYHHTSPRNRASIRREGLLPKDPKRSSAKGMSEEDTGPTPVGSYLGPHGHVASPGRDVWAINTNEVSGLQKDPGDQDNYWGFHYSEEGIPAHAMTLIQKGKRSR